MDITGETKLVGVLGFPVSHSLSPRMQNAAFAAMGLDMVYLPLPVGPDMLEAAIEGIRAMNFLGANVTIPHKIAVVTLLDRLDQSAALSGAVNTIVNRDGALEGHNTDGTGFIRALEAVSSPNYPETSVLLIGAGGAARSVALALADKGIRSLTILNRSLEHARDLGEILGRACPRLPVKILSFEDETNGLPKDNMMVINATSLGMEGNLKPLPVAVDTLTEDHVVCDLVYKESGETPFLAAAAEKGATTLGGQGMLLHQGAEAIHLWTGKEPPVDVMRQAIESRRSDIPEEL